MFVCLAMNLVLFRDITAGLFTSLISYAIRYSRDNEYCRLHARCWESRLSFRICSKLGWMAIILVKLEASQPARSARPCSKQFS